jgi:hypothetical protein
MNPEDNSPLVIPLKHKPIPFYVASLSGSKVEPKFYFNHNNPIDTLLNSLKDPRWI